MTVTAVPRIEPTIAGLRAALAAERAAGRTIALVPTMGALHDGHLSLIARASAEADVVVVSVFVNPTQFDDERDLARYPRDLARDAELAAAAGARLLFAPQPAELYPPGFCTQVRVQGPLTATLEGAHRGAAHFHGVTTVVTKLLMICAPDVAIFGAKDAQQARVLSRLVGDLDLPVRLVTGATVRDRDGLALSSRNSRLDPSARARALGLSAALRAASASYDAGERERATLLGAAARELAAHNVEPEYLELADAGTLTPLELAGTEAALVLVAATVDGVRLIDNTELSPPHTIPGSH